MAMITKIKTTTREEWLALRSRYIGGSDAAAVVGLNRFSSPYALWAEKTGRVDGFSGNLATEVGTYLEEFVARKFAEETGKKVRKANQSFFNGNYPFAIANIDREIVGEDAGLEIKTTSEMNLKKFKGGEYPANYYCQCMHYMAVTGKQRWYLAVLIGNRDFKWFTIERDEAEIAALMTAERAFWEYVTNDTPPPLDGAQTTTDTLTAVYADSTDMVVDLYPLLNDLEQYQTLSQQIKELEAKKRETANRIKAFLGDAGGGECDGYRVSWATSSRQTFDCRAFAEKHPDIDITPYFTATPTRIFRVTEKKGE